jgi:transposase
MEYWDHTMGPHERVALRANAVQAVNQGEKKSHVARRLGVTRQTLHNWVQKHRRGGAGALAARARGRVRRRVLAPWQEAHVAGVITRLPPSMVNPRYTRWTKRAIAEYIERSFGVPFSAWQVDTHLRRWGFESPKEVRRAFLNDQGRDGARDWALRASAEATA